MNGLKADGIYGPATKAKLEAYWNEKENPFLIGGDFLTIAFRFSSVRGIFLPSQPEYKRQRKW